MAEDVGLVVNRLLYTWVDLGVGWGLGGFLALRKVMLGVLGTAVRQSYRDTTETWQGLGGLLEGLRGGLGG